MIGIIIGSVFFLVGTFFLQGLRKIPADPPHKGLRTILGKRTDKVVEEGWNFFPFFPWWHGYVITDVTKKNMDLEPQKVRTPDEAELAIPVSVTFTPDADSLLEYFNSGGEAGVKTILTDIIKENLREWAIAKDEGPQTYKEAMASQEEATAILLKAILGDTLKPISSSIPTPILLRYFNKPPRKPTESQEKEWGETWEKVTEKLKQEFPDLNDLEEFKRAVEKRREEIRDARRGNGKYKKFSLGILLNRLNLGEIKPIGELAKAMELKVTEESQRRAEIVELNHVGERIEALKKIDFSNEQALEIIQTERGKVTKNISESKWNVSAETRAMIEKVGPEIVAKIFERRAQ